MPFYLTLLADAGGNGTGDATLLRMSLSINKGQRPSKAPWATEISPSPGSNRKMTDDNAVGPGCFVADALNERLDVDLPRRRDAQPFHLRRRVAMSSLNLFNHVRFAGVPPTGASSRIVGDPRPAATRFHAVSHPYAFLFRGGALWRMPIDRPGRRLEQVGMTPVRPNHSPERQSSLWDVHAL